MSIEQLFSQLAISGASMMGKAAFSYATSVAVRQISTYLSETPSKTTTEHAQLATLQRKLEQQFALITPSIDRCELLAAQGNTMLLPLLDMIDTLRSSIAHITDQLEQNGSSSREKQQAIMDAIQETLDLIRELVPFLLLGMQQSALHSNSATAGSSILSLSRLLQAAHDLTVTHQLVSLYEKTQKTFQGLPVGSALDVTVYTLFEGSVRPKSFSDFTWKEEIPRANVCIQRMPPKENLDYALRIEQNMDDGRYHEDTETPQKRTIPLASVPKQFYTSSGQLLNIEGAHSAVLVLKVVSGKGETSNSDTPVKQTARSIEWLALGLYNNQETSSSSSESEKDDTEPCQPPETPVCRDPGVLSRLDALLRLCALETYKQQTFCDIPDDLVHLFMSPEPTAPSSSVPLGNIRVDSGLREPMVRRMSLPRGVDSPLSKKSIKHGKKLFDATSSQ